MTEIVSVKAYHCFKCHCTRMKPFTEIPPGSGGFWHYKPDEYEIWCSGRPVQVVIRSIEGDNGE